MSTKKYRVSESELFNLQSMRDYLQCLIYDMEEKIIDWDDTIEERLEEVDDLLERVYCIGALVTWDDLERIREIRDERNMMRYNTALSSGCSEREAGYAFM